MAGAAAAPRLGGLRRAPGGGACIMCVPAPRGRAAACIYVEGGQGVNSESCVNCIQWLSACCAQPMRCALDGREEEVRAAVLLSAALGAAQVRASAACSRLRACDHSRLHGADTRRTAQGCALVQAAHSPSTSSLPYLKCDRFDEGWNLSRMQKARGSLIRPKQPPCPHGKPKYHTAACCCAPT